MLKWFSWGLGGGELEKCLSVSSHCQINNTTSDRYGKEDVCSGRMRSWWSSGEAGGWQSTVSIRRGGPHRQKSKVRSDMAIFSLYTASNFSFMDTVKTSFHRPTRPARNTVTEFTLTDLLTCGCFHNKGIIKSNWTCSRCTENASCLWRGLNSPAWHWRGLQSAL